MRTDEIARPETMTPRGYDVLDWSVTLTAAVGLGVLVLPWIPRVDGPLVTSTGPPSARGVLAVAAAAVALMIVRPVERGWLLWLAGRRVRAEVVLQLRHPAGGAGRDRDVVVLSFRDRRGRQRWGEGCGRALADAQSWPDGGVLIRYQIGRVSNLRPDNAAHPLRPVATVTRMVTFTALAAVLCGIALRLGGAAFG